MYNLQYTKQYVKEYRLAAKRGYDISLLDGIVYKLMNEETLEPKYRNHKLTGNYDGCYECHIKPDWLLIYEKNETELKLLLLRTGTHSDLF